MPYGEANSRLMLIDDRDPAVQYENSWARDLRFGSTISVSSTPNASVSMEFDGTRIIVVALAAPSAAPPTVQFTIDGALADPDPDTPGAAVYADWTFYALFDSQGLAEGRHTINATLLHAADEYPLMLDTFMFQPSKKYWGLTLAPETLQVDEDAGTGVGKGGKVDVGAVVGGVLGGLVLLALGVVLFWWCRRRRQHAYTSLGGEGHFSERKSSKTVTPFLSMRPTSVFNAEGERAYSDPSNTPIPGSSTSASAPSEYANTAATAASSSAVANEPHAAALETAPADHTYQEAALAESSDTAVDKTRRRSVADFVQAAIQATRWRASRREDLTPSDAPPRYSER